MRNIIASESEAEYITIFVNAQTAVPIHTTFSEKQNNLVQQVCGTFLYYSIAIDNTILPALRYISSEQPKSTTNTEKQVAKLLNYLASNPQA